MTASEYVLGETRMSEFRRKMDKLTKYALGAGSGESLGTQSPREGDGPSSVA